MLPCRFRFRHSADAILDAEHLPERRDYRHLAALCVGEIHPCSKVQPADRDRAAVCGRFRLSRCALLHAAHQLCEVELDVDLHDSRGGGRCYRWLFLWLAPCVWFGATHVDALDEKPDEFLSLLGWQIWQHLSESLQIIPDASLLQGAGFGCNQRLSCPLLLHEQTLPLVSQIGSAPNQRFAQRVCTVVGDRLSAVAQLLIHHRVVYYTRLVKENPERAIETFLYRDQQKHENEMRLIQKQLPQAQAFYNAQTAEAKARIDRDLEGVNPYFKDKAFVNAALREKDRQTRREFANPSQAPATPPPAAGAKIAA